MFLNFSIGIFATIPPPGFILNQSVKFKGKPVKGASGVRYVGIKNLPEPTPVSPYINKYRFLNRKANNTQL